MTLQDIVQDIRDKYVLRPTGREPVRPIPADLVRPPRYRYPSQRSMIPQTCGHCGVRLLVSDAPTAEHPLIDLSCYLCSRIAAELLYDGIPQRPSNPIEIDPTLCLDCEERPRATGRRVCALCASRRRNAQTAASIARGSVRCSDCGINPRTIKHSRCNVCRHKKEYAPRGQRSGT